MHAGYGDGVSSDLLCLLLFTLSTAFLMEKHPKRDAIAMRVTELNFACDAVLFLIG